MNQFITDNIDLLTLVFACVAILVSLAFGGILQWRQKICLEYQSLRNVALSILRDRFVQRASSHYSNIESELKSMKITVEQIYATPEQRMLVEGLSKDLADHNKVKSLFKWLSNFSVGAFALNWIMIVIIFFVLLFKYFSVAVWFLTVCMTLFLISLLGFLIAGSVMIFLDAYFFQLVDKIIEEEGE